MGCNDIATYTTGLIHGESYPAAVEGEGSPSEEQTEAPTGQSASGGYFWLEIDSSAVDAAVAVDRGEDGGVALVGGKSGVLDIEELGADLQGVVGSLAAVHPNGRAVGDLLRGGQAIVGDREAYLVNHVPQRRVVGGVEDHLVAGDGSARGAGHGVNGLTAVEEGELVALEERGVVVDDSLRELCHGGSRADGESSEADAAHKDVGGILGHTDARQTSTCDLVGREDSAAVESHQLGDVDFDHTEVGLDEGVVDIHACWQVFEPTAEHGIELAVDGTEVGPLGADAHLPCGAERCCGLDRQLADDSTCLGLAVEHLPHLATDASIDSKDFCHNVFPFCFLMLNFLLAVFSAWLSMCTCGAWLRKTVQKYRGGKNQNRALSAFEVHQGGIRGVFGVVLSRY